MRPVALGGVGYCICAFSLGDQSVLKACCDIIWLHCSSAVKHLFGAAAAAAACREEQKQMQRAAGVASFGDINQLLSTAPRDVVELLRIAGGFVSFERTQDDSAKQQLVLMCTQIFEKHERQRCGQARVCRHPLQPQQLDEMCVAVRCTDSELHKTSHACRSSAVTAHSADCLARPSEPCRVFPAPPPLQLWCAT